MDTQQLQRLIPPGVLVLPVDGLYLFLHNPKAKGCIFNCCPASKEGAGRRGLLWVALRCCSRIKKFFFSGLHWLVLWKTTKGLELFDSLARHNYAKYSPHLAQLRPIVRWRNTRRVQALTAMTCGAHCLFFVHHRSRKYKTGSAVMRFGYLRRIKDCDALVSRFVKFLIKKTLKKKKTSQLLLIEKHFNQNRTL